MKKKLSIILCLNILYLVILNCINKSIYNNFEDEIRKKFSKFNKVNINEIDELINKKKYIIPEKIESVINIGFTLDKNYVLETMLTVGSIMATQKKSTKVNFHFGVTEQFTADKMIKIYKLRNKIKNLTEFNFYYLKDAIVKMKNFHPKGEACPGKFELPTLLPDNIDRLIIFDAGDLLVFRDLSELYNYNMENYWVIGTPEPIAIESFMKPKYNLTKVVNIGSILLDIKKYKKINFWNKFINNKNCTLIGQPDQTLFNIF